MTDVIKKMHYKVWQVALELESSKAKKTAKANKPMKFLHYTPFDLIQEEQHT